MRERRYKILIFTCIGLAIALSAVPLFAQDTGERTVDEYLCKDVLRESGSSRDVAIAFLHGFLLGRSGQSNFNVRTLKQQTDKFLDGCLDHPGDKAIDVMTKVKG
jgi:hypothetical protein